MPRQSSSSRPNQPADDGDGGGHDHSDGSMAGVDEEIDHKRSSTRMIQKFGGSFSFELSQEFDTSSGELQNQQTQSQNDRRQPQKQSQIDDTTHTVSKSHGRGSNHSSTSRNYNATVIRQEQPIVQERRLLPPTYRPKSNIVNSVKNKKKSSVPSLEDYMSSDDDDMDSRKSDGDDIERQSNESNSMRSFSESSAGNSSFNNSSTMNSQDANDDGGAGSSSPVLELVKEETRVVRTAKAILVLGIVAAAIAVGTVTFSLVRREELKRFQREVSCLCSLIRRDVWLRNMPILTFRSSKPFGHTVKSSEMSVLKCLKFLKGLSQEHLQ